MSSEIPCEQIYPSNRPAICGLCKTVPGASVEICEARQRIIEIVAREIEKRGKGITNIKLFKVLRKRDILRGESNNLKNTSAVKAAINSGVLDDSQVDTRLQSLVYYNWRNLADRCSYGSGNNGSRFLATFSENSSRSRIVGKRAPHSD